jgi:hypothetical protein
MPALLKEAQSGDDRAILMLESVEAYEKSEKTMNDRLALISANAIGD